MPTLSEQLNALELQRQTLKSNYDDQLKLVGYRLNAHLQIHSKYLAREHPLLSLDEIHKLAIKDPKYLADVAVYDKLDAEFHRLDKSLTDQMDALRHGAKVGSGLSDSGNKPSKGQKPESKSAATIIEQLQKSAAAKNGAAQIPHDASVPQKSSGWAAVIASVDKQKPTKGHGAKVGGGFSNDAFRDKLREMARERSRVATPVPRYGVSLEKDGWAAFLDSADKRKPAAHLSAAELLKEAQISAQKQAAAAAAAAAVKPKDSLVSDNTASPSSWVGVTSVGVVVAMCACVAAFAVVRRRQRLAESAAPVVDGYATLV